MVLKTKIHVDLKEFDLNAWIMNYSLFQDIVGPELKLCEEGEDKLLVEIPAGNHLAPIYFLIDDGNPPIN